MAGVFVFSASGAAARGHYQRTIEQGVPLEELSRLISPEVRDGLAAAYPSGRAYLWAAQDSDRNRSYWNPMETGDLVLAYRDRGLVCASYVVAKVVSRELGLFMWADEVERPYDLIYFLTPPTFFPAVPVAELSQYFGEIYQGLRRVSGSDAILRDFGSHENFVRVGLRKLPALPTQSEAEEASPIISDNAGAGQGFEVDAAVRSAIELHAMNEAKRHFKERGFRVEDTSSGNPFDLRCVRGNERRMVEVKVREVMGDRS